MFTLDRGLSTVHSSLKITFLVFTLREYCDTTEQRKYLIIGQNIDYASALFEAWHSRFIIPPFKGPLKFDVLHWMSWLLRSISSDYGISSYIFREPLRGDKRLYHITAEQFTSTLISQKINVANPLRIYEIMHEKGNRKCHKRLNYRNKFIRRNEFMAH